MKGYGTTAETAEHWKVSMQRVEQLCTQNRIPGAVRFSRVWAIPEGAPKPMDLRTKEYRKALEGGILY